MKKRTLVSCLFAYVILLPYLCRLYRGFDWSLQYLPFGLFNNVFTELLLAIIGILFFGFFSALSAIPTLLCLRYWKHVPVTFFISLAATTGLLVYFHHDYDIAADAQAAIGLIFIPLYTAVITTAIAGVSGLIELRIRRKQENKKAPEDTA
ncbi:MAG: hypothetical protein PHW60_02955 [Kiritimatiellae bacterium]|nr:hypothetical protein [Kiritimatiellia bacterium]